MTTEDRAAVIAAAEARLAETKAELAAVQARHDAAITAARDAVAAEAESRTVGGVKIDTPTFTDRGDSRKPAQDTVADAIAEARRRGGGRTRSEVESERREGRETVAVVATAGTSAADGRAEAARRLAARR